MSIHFAPQWVKPIKPSGASVTPTDGPPSQLSKASPSVPFPALSQANHPRVGSPTTPGGGLGGLSAAPNPPLSYSRITHTPISPGVAQDGYFPHTDAPNGAEATPYPFRYSREQMLALWDEEKVKERPIELLNMDANGAVIVSKDVVRPVGLREMSEQEKKSSKILSSNVHPPAPVRRQPVHVVNQPVAPEAIGTNGGVPTRRPIGPPTTTKDAAAPTSLSNGRPAAGFGGFGRGEGGAFGGGKFGSASIGTGQPGGVGGGFGGVGKRARVKTEGTEVTGAEPARPSAASSWRPSRTLSGTFEGVLGFGNSASSTTTAPAPSTTTAIAPEPIAETESAAQNAASAGWRERERAAANGHPPPKVEDPNAVRAPAPDFGNGGGPGWGSGQRKWRSVAGVAQTEEKTLTIPITDHENVSESVMASASATPLPERDAAVLTAAQTPVEMPTETAPAPMDPPHHATPTPAEPAPPAQEKEDLSTIQWFYRDPNGQEQGPFAGAQMHDWYSHSYFSDDLPLRRESESTFNSLAELKLATGNAVQPFLSPIRPRAPPPPPNLPVPFGAVPPALSPQPAQQPAPLVDQFRGLAVQSPSIASPQYNNQFNNAPYSPQYMPLGPGEPGQFRSAQSAWSAAPAPQSPMNRINGVYGSIGPGGPIPSPNAPFLHQQQQSMFSPLGPSGTPAHLLAPGAEMFNAPTGPMYPQVSPWGSGAGLPGAPSPASAAYQQQQQPQQPWLQQFPTLSSPQPIAQPQTQQPEIEQPLLQQQPLVPDEPSYFPPAEQAAEMVELAEALVEETEARDEPVAAPPVAENELTPETEQFVEEEEPTPEPVPEPIAPKAAPPSVWGQKTIATPTKPATSTPSRKASLSQQTQPQSSIPATTSSLPPPPASLPAKPVTRAETSPVTATSPVIPTASVATPDRPSSKPAPWAVAEKAATPSSGPSLREIQETEARHAEARRQALADARAASASPAPLTSSASNDDFPSTIAWGLPSTGAGSKSSASAAVSSPSVSTPPAPAWGTGEAAAPKKTLKQIQEEEERRRAAVANQRAQALAAATASSPGGPSAVALAKRGYADLAATSAPVPATVGWTTVGAGGKASAPPPAATRPAASATATPTRPLTASIPPKPISTPVQTGAQKIAKANGAGDEFAAPSVEFIRWTKQALSGLSVNVDEFIQMLLQFPIDPPASSRNDVLEIISDSVYASSATLDGRHFAQEFFDRRKADATRGGSKPVARVGNLADVVKTQPKPAAGADLGFKVVKSKKGKKV